MSHPSLNPRRRPTRLRITASPPPYRNYPGSVMLFVDREFMDVDNQNEKWSTLAAVEGSDILEWRSTSLFEGLSPGDGLHLEPREAQYLIDKLWECGLRPTEGSGSAGSLAATQAHVDSLKSVVNQLFSLSGAIAHVPAAGTSPRAGGTEGTDERR